MNASMTYVMNHISNTVFFADKFYNVTPIYTHSSRFHADDVFASSLIFLLYKKQHANFSDDVCKKHFRIERIDNPSARSIVQFMSAPEGIYPLVYDIGGGEFDHHTAPREERPNGIAYSAFGKLWRACYKEFGFDETHYHIFDRNFVQHIDLADSHGVRNPLSLFIENLNPSDAKIETGECSYESAFEMAFGYATPILQTLLDDLKNRASWIAKINANGGFDYSVAGEELAVFDEPVNRTWVSDYTSAKAMLYPHRRGGYALESLTTYDPYGVPSNRWKVDPRFYDGSLTDDEKWKLHLSFAHPDGFLFVFKFKDSAIDFARKYL